MTSDVFLGIFDLPKYVPTLVRYFTTQDYLVNSDSA